jgi:RimJ/RimL family protein N-acetyltransferase
MFALTPRLTLRPGWPEDAPALARAIGQRCVAKNLSGVPWPYATHDAEAFLDAPRATDNVAMLIFSREEDSRPLVGGIGLHAGEAGHELGYWLVPSAWGRGIATEAGRAMVSIARDALRLPRLRSGHFADNPASGRVLAKLGFRPTGETALAPCPTRGTPVPTVRFALELDHGERAAQPQPLAA